MSRARGYEIAINVLTQNSIETAANSGKRRKHDGTCVQICLLAPSWNYTVWGLDAQTDESRKKDLIIASSNVRDIARIMNRGCPQYFI